MSTKVDHETSQRIRSALAAAPAKMALQMARDLGVPEVEIVRHLPSERAMELEVGRWEEIFHAFEGLGKLHVIVSNGMTTCETVGEFGGFSTWGEFFNVQSATLDMHIRFAQIASVFAVEKPSHMTGESTLSFQFFDKDGNAGLKVFLNFGGEPLPAQTREQFESVRERFRVEAS